MMLERDAKSGLITAHKDVSADGLHRSTAQSGDGERSAIALV